jgi:hypothetical protein
VPNQCAKTRILPTNHADHQGAFRPYFISRPKAEKMSSLTKKSNEILTDPMIKQIKALSRIDGDHDSSSSLSFMERTRTTEAKFQSLLLPEEWLEVSDAYLRLPPTLSDESFTNILKELDRYHLKPIRPETQGE